MTIVMGRRSLKLWRLLLNRQVLYGFYLEISIVLQILEFFKLMANASVVHCNLKPSSIIVSTDKKIKVINFTYGINRSKSKSAQI